MPLWDFNTPTGLLSPQEKETIATQVTNLYCTRRNFPKFWINVIFNEYPEQGYYNGGQTPAKACLFIISHAARSFQSEEEASEFHAGVDAIVRPVFEPKGVKWEYSIRQSPADHWRINGMVPPVQKPEVLKQWVEQDAAVVY